MKNLGETEIDIVRRGIGTGVPQDGILTLTYFLNYLYFVIIITVKMLSDFQLFSYINYRDRSRSRERSERRKSRESSRKPRDKKKSHKKDKDDSD